MSSFSRMATVSCSTERATLSDGKRGKPVSYLAALHCTPLDPVDPELRERLKLNTPHELLQTFIEGDPDIKEGDYLILGSIKYPIRSVADWVWRSDTFRHLILEDLKE